MNSLEWEVFKCTGKIEHYLLMKESDHLAKDNVNTEFSEEIADVKPAKVTEEE
ncbi:MAG: YqzL family protein [Turicibacter sp.]|nr:YqzL family protein [Turicibacter sp.]